MAIAAGISRSSSDERTGRTRGSGGTAGGPSMPMSGWRGRWSRHGPQYGASSSPSGGTDAAGPTIVEQRRPARRARSAKATAAERSAPGAANGMRLAPARQTASRESPLPTPQSGAPREAGVVPAASTRPASTQAATGSWASNRSTAGSSSSPRTRAVCVRSIVEAGGWPARRSGDGDDRRPGGGAVLRLLPGEPHGFLDERLDDLRLGNGLDDLALHEDLALAVARGDTEVGLAGLARAVHDAPHD